MKKYLIVFVSAVVFLGCSQDDGSEKKSDTIIKHSIKKSVGKDEALICLDADEKITCKLMTKRVNKEREVKFEWKSPHGHDDRDRTIRMPANHASIFDARDKNGRAKGLWKVEVEIDGEAISATFRIN